MCDINNLLVGIMHVEIKVAQNFVLNFLYNKLPRRRVNLFGEELESALRDKFADHWYPDKPFKGSAFRCLKITDPADPVLNRAARESGNPVPDIVENLPTDLAIWIDPGEVSYRIGEKGSVKILYSESMDGSYLQNYTMETNTEGNPEAAAVAAATAAAMAVAASFHNSSRAPGCSSGGGGQNFLPLDNLNLSMGGLTLNGNSQISPGSKNGQQQAPMQAPPPPGPMVSPQAPPAGPGNSSAPGPQASGGSAPGFVPFQPRAHQPITYTAGTFAQTKFGSTKLKSNAKKTNRMSPTEFSNYIKQRAMQKQGQQGQQGPVTNINTPSNGTNGVGAAVTVASPSGNSFMPITNGGLRNNSNSNKVNGFHSHHNSGGSSGNSGNAGPSGNLNYGGGSGRIPPHQQNQDPYFYPLFPDRSNQGNNGSFYQTQNQQHQGQHPFSSGSSSGCSSASSSSSSSSTTNPWSFGDADAELFLQDILTVGLQNSTCSKNQQQASSRSNNIFSDFGSSTSGSSSSYDFLAGNNGHSLGNSSSGSGGGSNSSSYGSNNSSLGLSMLNNLGGLGTFGSSGNSATLGSASGQSTNFFGNLEHDGIVSPVSLKPNNGLVAPSGGVNPGSPGSAGPNASNSSSTGPNSDKYQQQRVLVAN